MLLMRSNFRFKPVPIQVNVFIVHVPLMVCFPIKHAIASKFDQFVIYETHVQSVEDVNENTPRRPITLKCFATFVLSMHIINFAFKCIFVEIASVE